MIVRHLIDFNNKGILYLITTETDDLDLLNITLHRYSNDVRFVEIKDKLSKRDNGNKKLTDGSVIKRCQFICDKLKNRRTSIAVLKKAIPV